MKRHETCAVCGRRWNVSRRAAIFRYVCPICSSKARREAATAAKEALALTVCILALYFGMVSLI